MGERNFNVGDVCRVRQWDDMFEEFGGNDSYIDCDFAFVDSMKYMCGRLFTIASIEKHELGLLCRSVEGIEGTGTSWYVGTDMLELVVSNSDSVFEAENMDALLECLGV